MVPFEFSFIEKLNEVQARLCQEIKIKAADFEDLVNLNMDDLDKVFCPAIVLATGQACGDAGQKFEALAVIVQLIYIANQVHNLMKDDNDLAEDLRQFPVLVGDLLYGRFFLELCRENLLTFLEPLAQVIGIMSEGGIARWLSRSEKLETEELLQIINKESAALTAKAANLSAELAGVSLPIQNKLQAYGRELGLAWGAWKEGLENKVVQAILQKASDILQEIKLSSQLKIQPLYEVFHYLSGCLNQDNAPKESALQCLEGENA